MSKRGISPLIATVLLVGFTIVMAGIVSTFIIKQTKETFNPDKLLEDSTLCDQMVLGVVVSKADDLKIIQGSSINYLRGVYVQNKGTYAIRGITLTVDGIPDEMTYIFDKDIAKTLTGKDTITPLIPSTDAGTNMIKPGKNYEFGIDPISTPSECITELKNANPPKPCGIPIANGNIITTGKSFNIKIYPIIKDFEKDQPVKCAKSVLVIDYKELCNSYGNSEEDCTAPNP